LRSRGFKESYVGKNGRLRGATGFRLDSTSIAKDLQRIDSEIKRAQDRLEWAQSDYETALYERRQLSKDVRRLKSLIRSYLKRLKRAGCRYKKPWNLDRAR